MEFEIVAPVMPDFSKVDKSFDKKEKELKAEYETEISSQMEEGGAGGGGLLNSLLGMEDGSDLMTGGGGSGGSGGSGGGGGGMAGMAQLAVMAGGIMAIVSLLMSMEPIKVMVGMIMDWFKLILLPFVMGLMNLLMPVLTWLFKLMPAWLEFWKDPVGNIKNALSDLWATIQKLPQHIWNALVWLGQMVWAGLKEVPALMWKLLKGYLKIWLKMGQILWTALRKLGEFIWNLIKGYLQIWLKIGEILGSALMSFGSWLWGQLKNFKNWLYELPSKIWDFMQDLPSMIGDFIKDAIPFVGGDEEEGVFGGLLGDFVISDGTVYETDPNDTIMGTTNPEGMGGTKRVSIDVSGYSDEAIKDMLKREMELR